MVGTHAIDWGGEHLLLFWQRAVYWERCATLIITDPHFGKDASFRTIGLPIPAGVTDADLVRLTELLTVTQATRLIILGDFFHTRSSRQESTLQALSQWRAKHANLDIINIPGNHDRHSGDPPAEWRIACHHEPWTDLPFQFQHHPDLETQPSGFVMAGHLHPAVKLRDRMNSRLILPCFVIGERQMILPAFGGMTGNATITPKRTDRIVVVGPGELMELSS